MRTIYLNQDNSHFWSMHPAEDMSEKGLRRLVDFYVTGTQVKSILFCVNVQHALLESEVWKSFYADYDPDQGDDQPCLKRVHGLKNLLLLKDLKINPYKVWLKRCRELGVEGWISLRMNDCGDLDDWAMPYEDAPEWAHHNPGVFWRTHPELRRLKNRSQSGFAGTLDYAKPEVRAAYLAMINELLERLDPDGLELDWMHWVMMFAPGAEAAGAKILNGFLREVRTILDKAEHRLGHKIRLAHRVPADPQAALELGYDVIGWADEKLADVLILSGFSGATNFDYPITVWRKLVGNDVKLIASAECCASAYPGSAIFSYDALYGSAAAALQSGADGIYLINECYRESDAPELLSHVLQHCGQLETLSGCVRRHAVSYAQVCAPGKVAGARLPVALRKSASGLDFSRMDETIDLRINLGTKPEKGRVFLRLGFSGVEDKKAVKAAPVRINSYPLLLTLNRPFESMSSNAWAALKSSLPSDVPAAVEKTACWDVPLQMLQDGINLIEYLPPQVDGMLEWAELAVIPTTE